MNVLGIEMDPEGCRVCVNFQRDGVFEPESVAVWRQAATTGGLMVDVGAYTGLYALLAAAAGAKAVAYEPNPIAFERLIRNVGRSRLMVDCRNRAVSDKRETRRLWRRAAMTSAASFFRTRGESVSVDVECEPLEFEDRVAAIKVDVEGAELAVLRGAEAIIRRDRPVVIAEALTDASRRSLVLHMTGRGYSWKIADRRNLVFVPT